MQNKNILEANTKEHRSTPAGNQPVKEFPIQNIPVHSMKRDLEIIDNPDLLYEQENAPLPVASDPQTVASTPKTSPFLEKTSLPPIIPTSWKKPENSAVLSAEKPPLQPEMAHPSGKFDLKKVFVFSIIVLSAIALGVGSYYFWLIGGEDSEPQTTEPALTVPAPLPVAEPEPPAVVIEPEIKIEQPKENTIVLDLASSTPAKIKTEIKNQIEKLPAESFAKPVEFKLRDPQNNLINFSSFAGKSGIAFAQNLSAYLGESFSLFAFHNGSTLATGLIIESKNDSILTQELLKREAVFPKELDVLFLIPAPATTKDTSFSNFTYKDVTLRYFNLISPEKLTIDYAVVKNKLIIGTTKATHLALYDWLLLQPDIP